MRASEQRHLELPARRCSVTSTPTVGQPATQLVVAQEPRNKRPLLGEQIEHRRGPRVAVRRAGRRLVAGRRRVEEDGVLAAHDAVDAAEGGEASQQQLLVALRPGGGA